MTRTFQHKTNNKMYELTKIVDSNAYLIDVDTSNQKTVTVGTLHRYYKELDLQTEPKVVKKYDWHKCYKPYQKNSLPLWDGAITADCKLLIRDCDKNTVMICAFTKTVNCIMIQQNSGCKRYFTDIHRALKHILNNQDIRTKEVITKTFKRWLGLFNKSL